ncbi:hypothetical protein [Leeuwenhoekiella nanhaiensis]|uniref:Uncharacterized protein n=1 Tax=Leeuwenhoekiella nanhaiensis TaxID=1655491 RepID=A0A2G1VM33_9FLAO|nr:hypothetical protein [Leeuwenhoekiella nanhaiensis]PHQ27818.1 hypothetical protein CJ305_18165 [Leeuwenhoekiella nanhaiensis]
MKIDMILVFAVVTGFVAIPYIAFILFGSGATKKVASRLKAEAARQGINLEQKEAWNGREIALDTQKNKLLFGQLLDEKVLLQQVDLNTVSGVNLIENVVTKKIDGKLQHTLEGVGLELVSKTSQTSSIINFYDSELDAAQNYEVKRAKKWKELIEAQLAPARRTAVAA